MIDSLRNIGISESEYRELIEENNSIENLEPMDIEDKIMLLKTYFMQRKCCIILLLWGKFLGLKSQANTLILL